MAALTETFTATANYADGRSESLTAATWGSDDVTVARVSAAGVVEAVGAGSTTIFAETRGVRGSKAVRSGPRFSGNWQGCWHHLTCTPVPAGSVNRCSGILIGDQGVLTLTLAQDRDAVQGTLNLSGVLMNVTGSIASDGTLSMAGSRPNTIDAVSDWRSTISEPNLEGTFIWSSVFVPPPTPTGRILTDRLVRTTRVESFASRFDCRP